MTTTNLEVTVKEDDKIILNVKIDGKIVQFEISRGDYGIGVDVIGTKGTITEMGWVSDDDMDLIDGEE